MAAIGDGWEPDAWIEASWITGAWQVGAAAVVALKHFVYRKARRLKARKR